jgi:hypothetical protein
MGIIINQQIKIFILFILCISLITCLYNKYYKYDKYDKYELFTNDKFQDTSNINNTNSTDSTIAIFSDSEISNLTVKNAINNKISSLKSIFNKYHILDPGITINNNGLTCESWENYNMDNKNNTNTNNTQLNNCKIVEGSESNDPQCLVDNVLTSCSSFYSDGYINNLSSIDINEISNNMRVNIIRNSRQLITDINKFSSDIDTLLNSLNENLDLEQQQLQFIKYNKSNIDDKKNLLNKTTKDFEKNENKININKINFTNFLEKNNNNDSKLNLYYKIILGLIVTIIIIGIFNLLVTELL